MARNTTVESGDRCAVVSGSRNAWGDFTVKFYLAGVYQKDADYFTEDRGDALGTAEHWVTHAPVNADASANA